ncbi:MAG TPA: M20/M25/M40 family metallo-hydrolase [Candidatus Acidoferrales bacterium]|nr:M20/M25/M40 family metallo-hydrolase [Candidatus Acidoferrales bacterium]
MKPIYLINICFFSTCAIIFGQTVSHNRDTRPIEIAEKIIKTISPDSLKSYDNTLADFGTRHTMSDTVSLTRGIGVARRWIKSKFESFAQHDADFKVYEDRFELDSVPRISRPTTLVNVYGILQGKEGINGRYVVISGHYDSRCTDGMDDTSDAPGADDDGSGSSLVIEAARVFTSMHFKPDANIIFICFDGEEQGLYGSAHFADEAKKKNMDVIADLNNDIVGAVKGGNGTIDRNTVRVFSESYGEITIGKRKIGAGLIGYEDDSPSRELARYIQTEAKKFTPKFKVDLIYRQDRFLRGGDQESFNKNGYAAVRFTEPNEDYNHQHQDVRVGTDTVNGKLVRVQYGDLPKFVDTVYLSNVCKTNSLVAALLSISPQSPQRAEMLVDKLEYGTRLKWDNASQEKGVAGWKIYYRKTWEPFWSGDIMVHPSIDSTVEYNLKTLSKDEYIFGLSSVGTNGVESVPEAPLPGK